jgi:tRNA (adenine37-N6)-methyltransferase
MIEGIEPIGYVRASRENPQDDYWGEEESCIELTEKFSAESLQGLDDFSHIEVVFLFHRVDESKIVTGARHPRNNAEWPAIGIFAQRGKNRPNRIGCTICRVMNVNGMRIRVAELDAIDGTPVLDIKPVMAEYLPRHAVRQPVWSHEVMSRYWLKKPGQ